MSPRVVTPVVLVFGEDDHDREVLKILVAALRPDAPRVEKRRKPLVLMKDRRAAQQRKNGQQIAQQIVRDRKRFDVRGVVAHQDCDALEPAHEALSEVIEKELADTGVAAVAATPAWETEAWLFLWPDAAPAVVKSWARPNAKRRQLGLIPNAKEAYRKALGAQRKRPYEESDAPKIVAKACELGLVKSSPTGRSQSFDRFCQRLLTVAISRDR